MKTLTKKKEIKDFINLDRFINELQQFKDEVDADWGKNWYGTVIHSILCDYSYEEESVNGVTVHATRTMTAKEYKEYNEKLFKAAEQARLEAAEKKKLAEYQKFLKLQEKFKDYKPNE